jgi:hypothetical protein
MTLTELKALLDGATPAPWTVGYEALHIDAKTEKGTMRICDIRGWGHLTGAGHGAFGYDAEKSKAIQENNCGVISASRTALPNALALLEVMARALAEIYDAADKGCIDSPSLWHPHTGQELHKWHEEWMAAARKHLDAYEQFKQKVD